MTPEQIQSLVAAKAPETIVLDYKRDLPKDGKEFARDVCAMANASGGTILIGISEKQGCAEDIVGIASADIDAEILRLTSILRSGIEPRILRFTIEPRSLGDKTVLDISVQRSLFRPHWVIAQGDQRFYLRHNSGKAIMSLDEIRDAFINSAAVLERAAAWREERFSAISDSKRLLPHRDQYIWAALHLCPLSAFSSSGLRFDPQSQYRSGEHELRTISDRGNGTPNYLGWQIIARDHESKLHDYIQVYRDYRMEVVFHAGDYNRSGERRLWAGVLESEIGTWLSRFRDWAARYEYPFPALAFLSLLDTTETVIEDSWRHYSTLEEQLLLEPVMLEDGKFEPRSALRSAYDHLYQSYGFASCPHFDEQGQWKPKRPR